MTPERWERVKAMFSSALEQGPDSRAHSVSSAWREARCFDAI